MSEPVDAVITWVDGHDKAHQEKLANYLASLGISRPKSAAPTRFNQCGEIDYCVMSLLQFAPWLRSIYIVTDAQTPAIMQRLIDSGYEHRVKLIDHREIFCGFEQYLPTFNSLAIESVLWRIPGLANHFIYLNDDCVLLRPVSSSDFFRNKKMVLRGTWKVNFEKKWQNRLKKYAKHVLKFPFKQTSADEFRLIQESSAKVAGFETRFFALPHAPAPLIKHNMEQFFLNHPDLLSHNVSYQLRNPQQFWPISLAQHLEIKNNQVEFDNSLKAIMVNGAHHSLDKIRSRLAQVDNDKNITFICMQSIDSAPEATQRVMLEWFKKQIPIVL